MQWRETTCIAYRSITQEVCGLHYKQSLFFSLRQAKRERRMYQSQKESTLKTHVYNYTLVARFRDFITQRSRLVGMILTDKVPSSNSQTLHEKDQLLLFHDRSENFPQNPDRPSL